MEKEFIPYEQALAMKELGFDEPVIGTYDWNKDVKLRSIKTTDKVKAILYQQAFRWFREEKGLIGSLAYGSEYLPIWHIDGSTRLESDWSNTFEQAELACLNKLIELTEGL